MKRDGSKAAPRAGDSMFIGMDVHKASITVALAEEGREGEVRVYGAIENTPEALARLIKKLAKSGRRLRFCYEAGCCGYGVCRQLRAAGHECEVIAPGLIPRPAGDRVKTDRRDALMLAKLYRAGELTPVWVPGEAGEAMRDLVRSRIAAAAQLQRCRVQLQAFLLRHGRIYKGTVVSWTKAHYRWLAGQRFTERAHQAVFQAYVNAVLASEERLRATGAQIAELVPEWSMKPTLDALCALRGVSQLSAATLLASTGDLARFGSAQQLMSYFGLVPSERSSGGTVRRGGITKTGNQEVRRMLIQAAWCYRWPARVSRHAVDDVLAVPATVREIAWKAQLRLTKRYRTLSAKGKPMPVVITAIARELLGFIWAIGQLARPAPG